LYFEFHFFGKKWCLQHTAAPVAPTKGAAVPPAITAKIYDNIPLTASAVIAAVMGSAMLH
jgi:hypothetical protein